MNQCRHARLPWSKQDPGFFNNGWCGPIRHRLPYAAPQLPHPGGNIGPAISNLPFDGAPCNTSTGFRLDTRRYDWSGSVEISHTFLIEASDRSRMYGKVSAP